MLCVFRQSTLSLYCKFSVCVNVCMCVHAFKCIWMCILVCVWGDGEGDVAFSLFSSVLQVLTVYICVNILSPVHVRATVNKQKPVLLIKPPAVFASSFTLFPFFLGCLGCVRMSSSRDHPHPQGV